MPSLAMSGALCPNGFSVDKDFSRGQGAKAGENFAELALAISGHAGDAENFASMEIEIDIFQGRSPRLSRPDTPLNDRIGAFDTIDAAPC